jgi:hypothetical protein
VKNHSWTEMRQRGSVTSWHCKYCRIEVGSFEEPTVDGSIVMNRARDGWFPTYIPADCDLVIIRKVMNN